MRTQTKWVFGLIALCLAALAAGATWNLPNATPTPTAQYGMNSPGWGMDLGRDPTAQYGMNGPGWGMDLGRD